MSSSAIKARIGELEARRRELKAQREALRQQASELTAKLGKIAAGLADGDVTALASQRNGAQSELDINGRAITELDHELRRLEVRRDKEQTQEEHAASVAAHRQAAEILDKAVKPLTQVLERLPQLPLALRDEVADVLARAAKAGPAGTGLLTETAASYRQHSERLAAPPPPPRAEWPTELPREVAVVALRRFRFEAPPSVQMQVPAGLLVALPTEIAEAAEAKGVVHRVALGDRVRTIWRETGRHLELPLAEAITRLALGTAALAEARDRDALQAARALVKDGPELDLGAVYPRGHGAGTAEGARR